MIIKEGEKLHVIYRALYEGSARMHIAGEVVAVDGSICRIDGYVFIYDTKLTTFSRKAKRRVTIIDIAESGYVVNIIDSSVDLDEIEYKYKTLDGVVVTDNKDFSLNINEFGPRS